MGLFSFEISRIFRNDPPSRIKVFISYSSKDSILAGKINDCFEKCVGFEVFLAHDDLTVSNNWPKEILKHLTEADFVVPLLSRKFMRSFFANQEIGIAFCKELKMIPFSLDGINSDGFIRDIQAHKSRSWNDSEILRAVVTVFLLSIKDPSFKKYNNTAINCLLNALLNSELNKTTDSIVNILLQLKSLINLNKAQVDILVRACKNNAHVYNAKLSFPKLKKFLQYNYNIRIDS